MQIHELKPAKANVLESCKRERLIKAHEETAQTRTDVIRRVRIEIAAGRYETPERLDATVDRMMDDLRE